MEQILYTKPKLCRVLGVGEDVVDAMGLPFIPIGERNYYDIFAVFEYIETNRRNPATGKRKCRSIKGKTPTIGTMTSASKVVDFAEALKQTAKDSPNP